jgi:Pyruvate/2-oxoacid:ferredoxin oxidoreductase gamma subunit
VLLLGQLLAEVGMREGLEVSWLPSYGPEMRSGSAHCHVCLSKDRIGSPLISRPQVLIAMNEISLRKFAAEIAPGGVIIYAREKLPEDLVLPQAQVVCIPASEIADKLGFAKSANIVLLGALLEAVGTGGTLMGIARALREVNPNMLVVAVEPAECAVLSRWEFWGFAKGEPEVLQGVLKEMARRLRETNRALSE